MKTFPLRALWVAALMASSTCLADTPGFSIVSPDEPPVWYDRTAGVVYQELQWNRSKQQLVLYVSFSYDLTIHERDLLSYDSFRLSFPTVRLNPETRALYFTGSQNRDTTIGHLNRSAFGARVILDPGVQVVTRRHGSNLGALLEGPAR